MSFLDMTLGGIQVMNIIMAFSNILLTLVVHKLLNCYIFKRVMRLTEKLRHDYDDQTWDGIENDFFINFAAVFRLGGRW